MSAAGANQASSLRRSALLGTVAAGLLLFGYGRSAQAQIVPPAPPCNDVVGTTVTCTGNLQPGVEIDQRGIPSTFYTLNVSGLTQNIAPAMGHGIEFRSEDAVSIISDTTDGPGGPFGIIVTGKKFGIVGHSENSTVDIISTGDITQTGGSGGGSRGGIEAQASPGAISVTQIGDISAYLGISAHSGGNTTITFTGTMNARLQGITAQASDAGSVVTVTTVGNVSARFNVISALGPTAIISSTGDVSSTEEVYGGGHALSARATTGNATITSVGNVAAGGAGIRASTIDGDASVTSTGDIEAGTGNISVGKFGILAHSDYGSVSVNQTGNITMQGSEASGIFANADYGSATVNHAGNITTGGVQAYGIGAYGKTNVSVTSSGSIATGGPSAHGIHAISSGGSVSIQHTGDVTVTGDGSDAIAVTNPDGAGSSLVIIKAGSTITGGTGSGDGVDFAGGTVNRLKNFGTITTLGENAIEGEGSGAEIVDNYGTVTGNIHLGDGANAFNNMSGGVFNSAATAFLGAGNLFTNAGIFAPGGVGTIRATALTGNLAQTSGGSFAVDLDLGAATADRVNVTGTAKLNGTVAVMPTNLALLTHEFVILSADGGVTDNGLALGPLSPALQAVLLYPNANDVVLGIDVDFAPAGVNRNETNIGNTLNAVLAAGGGALGPVFNGLLNVFTLKGYRNALDQLSPEIYADTEIAALYSSFDFSDNLLSCHMNGTTTASINHEGQCVWVGAKGRYLDGDANFQGIGFEDAAAQFSGGAQFALNSDWRLGFGVGYQTSSLTSDTNATSDGEQVQGGVALKYNPGALLLAGVFSGGRGWYDTTRPMAFGGFAETARSDHEIDVLQGRLHASYVLGSPGLYYKPMLDVVVTDVALDDVRETGAGGANLLVQSDGHTVFSVSPGLEVGTEWWWSNGTLVRPFVRGGLSWYSEDDVTVRASFSGAPSSVGSFAIAAATDDVQADVAAGIEMISSEDSALRIFYDGHFGDRLAVHAAGFKASVKF